MFLVMFVHDGPHFPPQNFCMGEQPLAIAFCDPRCEEFVWDGDLFWGTIYRLLTTSRGSTRYLTLRNNARFEFLLLECLPTICSPVIRHILCHYLHLHY
jgi:hypothetical protein